MIRVADYDASLVERCKQGDDRSAFDEIVERYKDRIVSYVRHMVPDRDEADDLAQEVFVRVYTGLRSFESRSTLATWLFRIATNLCIDYRRRNRRPDRKSISLENLPDYLPAPRSHATSPEAAAFHSDLAQRMNMAIAELPDRLKVVVVLHDIQGLPYEDIARIVGCPLGTVKSRLFHARAALRERLQPYLRGEEENRSASRRAEL